jgi:hypothetical protein
MRGRLRLSLRRMPAVFGILVLGTSPCVGQTNVLTYHNDNARTGQNLTETILAPSTVRSSTFGKLFTVPVDGKVDAQPLYVSAVAIPGRGVRNVVYAATEHDSLYAFDADSGTVYWQISLLGSGETTSDNRGCGQVTPEIGITATPVIDLAAGPHGTLYVLAMSKDSTNYYHRLHALDITTGTEQFGGPVNIQASYPGSGDNSIGGNVIFDPKQYKTRPGLLLLNGAIYTGWGSHCDFRPYTGWLMGYDKLTLQQNAVFNFAPNGNEAGLWASGGGIATDVNGNIFVQLANGTFDTALNTQGFPNQGDYGNAFVKLAVSSGRLQALDYWTMDNTVIESSRDEDLGSGGPILLPDLRDANGSIRHLGTGAGKDGNIYVFDRDNMGRFDSAENATIYQELPGALSGGGGEFASPAWFNGAVYYGSSGNPIRAFTVRNALLSTSPASTTSSSFGFPGVTPSISASGTSNAILWAVENSNPAILHAYDAANLATEFYNSSQAPSGRDQFGPGNKFITPTIANGKVFVGTTNSVAVFGLLQAITAAPSSGSGISQSFTFTFTNPAGASKYYQAHMLFNAEIDGRNACYLIYDARFNGLYIANDQGDGIGSPVTPGGSGAVSNNQCSVTAASAAVSLSGANLIITVGLNFAPPFAGPKNVYAYTFDNTWTGSGWNPIGTWTVPQSSGGVAVNPSSGSGISQNFTFTFTNPAGASNYYQAHMLLNAGLNGLNACYLIYDTRFNALYSANDQGDGIGPPVTPGSGSVVSSSQCSVAASGAAVSLSGTNLVITLGVNFAPNFAGPKATYAFTFDNTWTGSGWIPVGTWTVSP